MGIRPESVLVLPKLTAMLISMPVLTVFGNVAGIVGGMLIGVTIMKIPFVAYWTRTIEVLDVTTFLLGTAKSIPFAILITLAGCYCGFNAANNSQGVGRGATKAVVASIFLVVVADIIRLSVTETERKAYGKKNGAGNRSQEPDHRLRQ